MDQVETDVPPLLEDNDAYVAEVRVSAKTQEGFENLFQTVAAALASQLKSMKLLLPYERGDIVSQLFEAGRVEQQDHVAEGVILEVKIPAFLYERYKDYEYPELEL